MTAYDKVKAARAAGRRTAVDYISGIFDSFIELHGDRRFGDDRAVLAGIASLGGLPVTIIGIEKGHDAKERALRNCGAVHPEGYRKALRQMKLAEKFGRPVICLIDTSGAACDMEAEERGQGQAIAENLCEMMTLRVPVISVLIGEGGSGGALALGVADEVWMLENAVYSVISPEGCASILWKDPARVAEASECLRLTAEDLLHQSVIDRIIPETPDILADLREALTATLTASRAIDPATRCEQRYQRFRMLGRI